MRDREVCEGGDLVGGLAQHRLDLAVSAAEHAGDDVELGADVFGVGLGEDGADRRGDHLRVTLGHLGEHIAQEMDSASFCQAAPSITASIAALSPVLASLMTS